MKLRNKKTGDIWEFEEGFLMKASKETNTPLGCMYKLVNSYTVKATTLGGEEEE